MFCDTYTESWHLSDTKISAIVTFRDKVTVVSEATAARVETVQTEKKSKKNPKKIQKKNPKIQQKK